MVLQIPELESSLGMKVYTSTSLGIRGKIRGKPEEFVVEEILTSGSKASVQLDETSALRVGHGRYLVCVLIKKNWDTFSAIRKLAHVLSLEPDRIRVAGIKDTRALTGQYVSIGGFPPHRTSKVKLRNIRLIPVRFSSKPMSSILLLGNHFEITVREISYCPSTTFSRIHRTNEEIDKIGGVPNFFGHQRFGTIRPVTHLIGKCLVNQEFEKAERISLETPFLNEHPLSRTARSNLKESRDYKMALQEYPRSLFYERLMIKHLSRYSHDFLGAFRRLPQNIRAFYVQAYQSYLFNKFLSERIKQEIPLNKAQYGDYVIHLDGKGLPNEKHETVETSNISKVNKSIDKGTMAVALPLVGFKQTISKGIQGEIESKILESEKVSPRDFQILKMPEASAKGTLRQILMPIFNFNFKVFVEPSSQKKLGAKFSFILRRGSYATVVLREFMKSDDPITAGY